MTGRAAAALAWALLLAAARAGAQVVPGAAQPPALATGTPAVAGGTALEAWLTRPGRVVVERTRALPPIALGDGAAVLLEAVVAFEPVREHERALGARVRLRGTERTGHAALAYLDPFEVDDLARTLAALPGLERLERASGGASEIRHLGKDGFGVVVRLAPGGGAPERSLRFAGDPPVDFAATDAVLAELRRQLDEARSFFFDVPAAD